MRGVVSWPAGVADTDLVLAVGAHSRSATALNGLRGPVPRCAWILGDEISDTLRGRSYHVAGFNWNRAADLEDVRVAVSDVVAEVVAAVAGAAVCVGKIECLEPARGKTVLRAADLQRQFKYFLDVR